MSENITFNLPITISRERFDAIVKEAARKIYTDGLFDPTDALAPAVAEAVQKQMGAPQATPSGVIQAGAEPSARPEPVGKIEDLDLDPHKSIGSRLLDLYRLINSGSWVTYNENYRGKGRLSLEQPVAVLFVEVDGVKYRICYMRPKYGNTLFLAHRQKPVRDVLGYAANDILRAWMAQGVLDTCRGNSSDKYARFSKNVNVLGQSVTVSQINIFKFECATHPIVLPKFKSP
jgi:hypothetical protein